MGILELESIDTKTYHKVVDNNSIAEWGDTCYVCKSGIAKLGDYILTADPCDEVVKVVKVSFSNNHYLFADGKSKDRKIRKYHRVNAYHMLEAVMKTSDRASISQEITASAKKVSDMIKDNPVWKDKNLLYKQRFDLNRSVGNYTVAMLIYQGKITLSIKSPRLELPNCRFEIDTTHDRLDVRMKNNITFQLFGEELVYIKNLIETLIKHS